METLKTMLAEMQDMKTNQVEADADRKAWLEEIRAKTEVIRARTKAMREERMKANMDACMADIKMIAKKRRPAKMQWRPI
jgi:hypothetical protein